MKRSEMIVTKGFLFASTLFVMACLCVAAWDAWINNRVYNCTDGGNLDFLFPGQWIHSPVTVDQVVSGRSMSEPDQIKAGWSAVRLWVVWGSFVAISILASLSAAVFPFRDTGQD